MLQNIHKFLGLPRNAHSYKSFSSLEVARIHTQNKPQKQKFKKIKTKFDELFKADVGGESKLLLMRATAADSMKTLECWHQFRYGGFFSEFL